MIYTNSIEYHAGIKAKIYEAIAEVVMLHCTHYVLIDSSTNELRRIIH